LPHQHVRCAAARIRQADRHVDRDRVERAVTLGGSSEIFDFRLEVRRRLTCARTIPTQPALQASTPITR